MFRVVVKATSEENRHNMAITMETKEGGRIRDTITGATEALARDH